MSETVSRMEEGAKDAASRVESFFEESAGSRVDEELSSAGDRARSRCAGAVAAGSSLFSFFPPVESFFSMCYTKSNYDFFGEGPG